MLLMLLRVKLKADLTLNALHFKSICSVGYEDMLTGQDCQADNINTALKAFMEYFFQPDNINTVHKAFME